jgi:hypothetical protein
VARGKKRTVPKTYGFVYLFVSQSKGWYKIGRSAMNAENRLSFIRRDAPGMKIDLVDYIPTDDFERLERAFHKVFRDAKLTEEDWATVDANQNDLTAIGKSEWFKLDAHQVELFRALAQTVGVSGSTVAMVRQVKRVEGLLEMFERGNKSGDGCARSIRTRL